MIAEPDVLGYVPNWRDIMPGNFDDRRREVVPVAAGADTMRAICGKRRAANALTNPTACPDPLPPLDRSRQQA